MEIGDNLTKIILAIIGIVAVGAFITIKKSNKVNQKNIKIKGDGDVVGRDKIEKKDD